jgi:hypothetical protein
MAPSSAENNPACEVYFQYFVLSTMWSDQRCWRVSVFMADSGERNIGNEVKHVPRDIQALFLRLEVSEP